MNAPEMETTGPEPWTVYCARCGQAMMVAPAHAHVQVACPHCRMTVEPWRASRTAPGKGGNPPPPPPGRAYASFGPGVAPAYGPDGPLSWRSRWIAGLLGVVLGSLGVHRFYLGFTGIGILQIVLTIVTFGIAGVWGFIEGILCFFGAMRDVDGLPLRD